MHVSLSNLVFTIYMLYFKVATLMLSNIGFRGMSYCMTLRLQSTYCVRQY